MERNGNTCNNGFGIYSDKCQKIQNKIRIIFGFNYKTVKRDLIILK
jgi:hypothetical protein